MFSLLLGIALTIWGFVGTLFYDAFWGVIVFSTFTHITPQLLSEAYIVPLRIPFFLSVTVLLTYFVSSKYSDKFSYRPAEFWLILTMVIGMTLGSFYAYDSDAAWEGTIVFGKYTVFFILFVNLIDSRHKLNWFVNALFLSCAWMVYKCWDLRGAGPRFEYYGGGVVNDSNQFAAALILMLPLVVNKALKKGDWRIRIGAGVGAFGMMMAIVISGSRAGFLGFAVGSIAFIVFYKQHRKKVFSLLLLLIVVAMSYTSEYYIDRMSTIFSSEKVEEDASSQGRLEAWRLSMNIWKNNPILGCGMRNFGYYMGYQSEGLDWGQRGHVAHSLWFEALGEGGLMVFIPLVAILSLFFLRTTKSKRAYFLQGQGEIHDEIASLQIGMIGFLIAATFVNRLFYEPIYWWCAMAIVHQRVLSKSKEEKADDRGPTTGV